ncbi:MotA/TolQ/ExbB proton channel family protein [Thiofaba sp. EF100]|uniref:MotA/TolQ/ExbB proton channel family protein n=1 Tax=Thiofaba sp. EF100 TaxID=3121274 RepID=UPI003221FC81
MLELLLAGGWWMAPILLASVVALGLIIERAWSLRRARVLPPGVVEEIERLVQRRELTAERLRAIGLRSPLGRVLVAGLAPYAISREEMKARIEDAGRHVAHELECCLTTLGTIAVISPLLGLLGTVVGMIMTFDVITSQGLGRPSDLAGGISTALLTTAAGLIVAVPSVIAHRAFRAQVDRLVIDMEREAMRLLDGLFAIEARAALREAGKPSASAPVTPAG